jgi:hypothetical protein
MIAPKLECPCPASPRRLFTQGSASPLTQSFSTGQFTPTAVGYAMESDDTTYTNDVTIGGLTYTTG